MENNYKSISKIRYSEVDKNYEMRFDAILDAFQNLTTFHSYEMKIDKESLKSSSNGFFVITRMKFSFDNPLLLGEDAEFITYPEKVTTLRFYRGFEINGENGKRVKGYSEWCVLDCDTLMPRKSDTVAYPHDLPVFKYFEDPSFIRFNEITSEKDEVYRYAVKSTDIDGNGHTNNAAYSRMAVNAFSPDEFGAENFKGFEIDFISQTYYDDEIAVYKKKTNAGVYVEGKLNDKPVFKSLFKK